MMRNVELVVKMHLSATLACPGIIFAKLKELALLVITRVVIHVHLISQPVMHANQASDWIQSQAIANPVQRQIVQPAVQILTDVTHAWMVMISMQQMAHAQRLAVRRPIVLSVTMIVLPNVWSARMGTTLSMANVRPAHKTAKGAIRIR